MSLNAENLAKRYADFELSASFEVGPGEILVLAGPSGCGKTTLLQTALGLIVPDSGRLFLDGIEIGRLPPWRRRLGVVFQDLALFPHLTVGGNVGFGPASAGLPRAERVRRTAESLRLARLDGYADRRIATLSGGERQRAAIARALAAAPRALLLDEPFSSLDPPLRRELRREVRDLVGQIGLPCVFVTHDREEAAMVGDRLAVMRAGRIVESGPARKLFAAPNEAFTAQFLGLGTVLGPESALGRMIAGRYGLGGRQWLLPPEAVVLQDDGPVSAGIWRVRVAGALFSGERWEVELETAAGETITTFCDSPGPPAAGESRRVRINPDRVRPLC